MKVEQIYKLMNTVTSEILGDSVVVSEDLSNTVDIGVAFENANALDNYVRSLVNHIGKVVFVNRVYRGGAPSVLMDGWEYGSILEKISMELPDVEINETWTLEDRTSYDPNIFYKPKVSAKFFNKRVTFEIPISITEKQVKESFSNAMQLNGFISMIYNAVENAMTVNIDALVMRTINNMIAETIHAEYNGENLNSKSTVKAVNLLKLYNDANNTNLTGEVAIKTPEFVRYASLVMKNYIDRLSKISTLFNIEGKERFTPRDLLHVVMLADFKNSAETYLQSDTFHDEYTALPNAETVPYWQGSGEDFGFGSISEIIVNTASGNEVEATGILAVMFDRDALGVANLDRRVTTNYNAKAEFWNNYNKFEAGYFNDLAENFVVFFAE